MKVSIITATYNSADTIGVCIQSVLQQTYTNIEYIIVDGASTDATLGTVQQLTAAHSHVHLSSEPDKGIYDALNKGVAKATGDIIGFVHSDDFLASPAIIEDIVAAFTTHKADGVYGDLHYVAHGDTAKMVRNWISKPFKKQLLRQGWMPAHPTLYLKKDIYRRYGGFDLEYKIAADYDFILRIFKQDHLKFYYLPKTIVKMRVGGASNRSLKNIIQKTKEDYRVARTHNIGGLRTILLKNTSKLTQFFN